MAHVDGCCRLLQPVQTYLVRSLTCLREPTRVAREQRCLSRSRLAVLARSMASIAALLDTFDDFASLSRAAALADDMQRQRTALQDELAAVERALPAALAAVQSDTRSAIEQLDRLADERTALEESVAQQMGVSQQLLTKLEPPLTKLAQLDEARLTPILTPTRP